jgi:transcriptional accessory protein Tex/SPT6
MGVTGLGLIEFYRSYSCPSRHRPSPDFGAFIEIKEGVDGLIHVSDMSWTKKINHGKAVLPQGQAKQCPLRGQEGSVIIAQIC